MRAKRRPRTTSTYSEQMRNIYKQHIDKGGRIPVRLDDLYAFTSNNMLWQPQPADARKKFCADMSWALREDYFKDSKGRTVRRTLAAMHTELDENGKKVRKSLWDDIDTAPRPTSRTRSGSVGARSWETASS